MKKLLLTLGALSAVAMPIAAVVSCGSGSKPGVTPPAKGTPGTTPPTKQEPGNTGTKGIGGSAGGSAGTAGQPGAVTAYLSVGAQINTLDRSDTSIQKNVVLDKDGHILSWPAFVPVKGTRAQSRHPDVTDPHPTTVMAEPFTRTTSPGAMDVSGWTPDYKSVPPEPTKDTDTIKQIVQDQLPKLATTTIDPISFDEFSHLDEILHGHLLILDGYDSVANIDLNDDELVYKIMNLLGINLKALGISVIQSGITRAADTGLMIKYSVKTLTLKNVIFTLKGESTYLPIDIKILIK